MRIRHTATAIAACFACVPTALAQQPSGGVGFDADAPDTLNVRGAAMLNRNLSISGSVTEANAGEAIVVQRQRADRGWETIAGATAAAGGGFATTWRANRAGRHALRAVTASTAHATATAASVQHPTGHVTVYRSAVATWFGPGFYGKRTACGQTMTTQLVGVAHKKLPCGTQVEIYYKGRTVTAPVVDRGPFAEGKTWDLTKAAADAIGFTSTARIGAVRVG